MTTRAQGQRDVAVSSLPFRGIAINDDTLNTAAITVYASDSGILFINENTATTTYTLPAVADGKGKFWVFFCEAANSIVIASSESKLVGGTTSAGIIGATITSAATIGECAMIIGDGDKYYCLPFTGTWTYST